MSRHHGGINGNDSNTNSNLHSAMRRVHYSAVSFCSLTLGKCQVVALEAIGLGRPSGKDNYAAGLGSGSECKGERSSSLTCDLGSSPKACFGLSHIRGDSTPAERSHWTDSSCRRTTSGCSTALDRDCTSRFLKLPEVSGCM